MNDRERVRESECKQYFIMKALFWQNSWNIGSSITVLADFLLLSMVSFACHSSLSENGVQNYSSINKCHPTFSVLSSPPPLSSPLLSSAYLLAYFLPPSDFLSIFSTLLIFSPFYLFSSLSLLPCFWTVNLPPWLLLRPHLKIHTQWEQKETHKDR